MFDTITNLLDQTFKAAIFVNFTVKKRSELVARSSTSEVYGTKDEREFILLLAQVSMFNVLF